MDLAVLVCSIFLHCTNTLYDEGSLYAKPNSELPGSVNLQSDKVSLYADFSNSRIQQVIPVYLINNTDEQILVPAQDRDLFIKAEAKIDGRWQRVQTHKYSSCILSYRNIKLPPKHYLSLLAGVPYGNRKCDIRFRTYSELELVTSSAKRKVDLRFLGLAREDALARWLRIKGSN